MYGMTETNTLAMSCACGNLHLAENKAYFEIVDPVTGEQLGTDKRDELVVTNHVKGMPLIRYKTGDLCTIYSKKCNCGSNFKVLEHHGRQTDHIKIARKPIQILDLEEVILGIRQSQFYTIKVNGDLLKVGLVLPEEKCAEIGGVLQAALRKGRIRMFKLSYNTNGLRNMPLTQAIAEVSKAGYEGIELSLHAAHLHPFKVTDSELAEIKKQLETYPVKPICLATGCSDLLSDVAYEPSLITDDKAGRTKRIELIKKSMEIARYLSIPVVNFASGKKKPVVSAGDAAAFLEEVVRECLMEADDIILAIEPEPDMFVETTGQAIALIDRISSPNLKLNLDIGHVVCCEEDVLASISKAVAYTRHTHIEDIRGRVHHHEIPGTADIDFKPIFKILENAGYVHYLSVELYHHANVWQQALKESRDYLLGIMS